MANEGIMRHEHEIQFDGACMAQGAQQNKVETSLNGFFFPS